MGRKIKDQIGKQNTESVQESVEQFFRWLLNCFSGGIAILILGVLPFYFQDGFTHIGSDKSYFFRTGTVMIGKILIPVFGGWVMCALVTPAVRRKIKLTGTDIFALLYAFSAILSYVCSRYPETALWGTKGWYMGLIPQLTFVSIYFLVSKFTAKRAAKYILLLGIVSSVPVFLLGLLNRFDIWPLPMANSGRPLFISTIGNINWYCSYAVTVAFVGIGVFWIGESKSKWVQMLLACYVFLAFVALITQGSESGIFASVMTLFVLFLVSAYSGNARKIECFWQVSCLFFGSALFVFIIRWMFPGRMNLTSRMGRMLYSPLAIILLLVCGLSWVFVKYQESLTLYWMPKIATVVWVIALIVVIGFISAVMLNTLRPGVLGALSDNVLFVFNDKWGSARGATWSIGIECFVEQSFLHKLVGVGPDCMAEYLYKDAGNQVLTHAKTFFAGKRLTNTHCEILTILVNMGILAACAYVGMFLGGLKKMLSSSTWAFVCGLGVLAYAFNQIWSFQQSMGAPVVFVIFGIGAYFLSVSKTAE